MAITLTEALDNLEKALNNELSLKNENLLYWIRTNIQAVVN